MIRHAVYALDKILPLIKERAVPVELDGRRVAVGVKRLVVFATKGIACVTCKVPGVYFALEAHKHKKLGVLAPHLNLYTASHVLMTIDHIRALADGGGKEMDNLQTMCSPCNRKKGSIKGKER